PIGSVDEPAAGSTVKNSVEVNGWALAQAGISEVALYLDARRMGTAKLRIPRPDVQQAYPQYRDSLNAGFRAFINLNGVEAGTHLLRVELLANDGVRHDLAKIPLTVNR